MSASSSSYRVLLKRGVLVDDARGGREVPYKVYYPVDIDYTDKSCGDGGGMPVVIWSHGFGGSMDGASFISRHIAGQGYIVVHPTHKGTDSSLWEGKGGHPWDVLSKIEVTSDMILERVADISFVLDKLPELPEIGAIADMSRVGISGHSLGAITTQALAGMKMPDGKGGLVNVHDKRFCCAVLYSPVPIFHLTEASDEEVYGSICIPVLHMTGTEDYSPMRDAGDYRHRLVVRDNAGHPEQYLQVLDGGDHMIYNGTRGKLARNLRREEHEALIVEVVSAFWRAYLKDDGQAKVWLQENYGR